MDSKLGLEQDGCGGVVESGCIDLEAAELHLEMAGKKYSDMGLFAVA